MKITFLGAARTVTGSNFLVEAAGKKFLVDCGMFQGKAEQELENDRPFDFEIGEIDFMLLTHAHIDHSGRIPKLYKDGYRNPIYTHKATRDLCSIMLPDSGHIQEMEIEWKNKKRKREGKRPLDPLYTVKHADACMELFRTVSYDEIVSVDENIDVRFNDAGHMLGSSIIEIWARENGKVEKAVFTGDLGNNDIPLLASPTMIESADYLVMESTYGSRLHMRNDEKAQLFLDIVSETLENKGTVVIPSFAVGRTQEIIYEINKLKDQHKDDPEFEKKYEAVMKALVYVDSPLAISATQIFRDNMNLFEDEIQEELKKGDNPLEFPGLKFTQTAEESMALNESNIPSIIISSSGMCEVGRIKHHLKHNLWNPNSTILFVGYQAPGTLGSRIVNGEKNVRIFGEDIAVRARVEYIEGYSGHADQEWLLNFIYSFILKPKHIFLVHGEEEAQDVLKEKIETNTNIPVIIPQMGETYELGADVNLVGTITKADNYEKKIRLEILDRLENLKNEINDMNSIVRADLDSPSLTDKDIFVINERIKDLEQQIVKIIEG